MNEVKENPAAMTVIKIQKLEERLATALEQLEKVLGGLNQYLQSKRGKFPRFFFLSDGELLEILSETKEPLKVQPHLRKCFEGINALDFDSEKKIHGMYSSEKENVPFITIIDPVQARGNVEEWLIKVEETMLSSIKDCIEKCMQDYQKRERTKWVISWPGQAILCADMVFWTDKAETAMKKNGLQGLETYYKLLTDQVSFFL